MEQQIQSIAYQRLAWLWCSMLAVPGVSYMMETATCIYLMFYATDVAQHMVQRGVVNASMMNNVITMAAAMLADSNHVQNVFCVMMFMFVNRFLSYQVICVGSFWMYQPYVAWHDSMCVLNDSLKQIIHDAIREVYKLPQEGAIFCEIIDSDPNGSLRVEEEEIHGDDAASITDSSNVENVPVLQSITVGDFVKNLNAALKTSVATAIEQAMAREQFIYGILYSVYLKTEISSMRMSDDARTEVESWVSFIKQNKMEIVKVFIDPNAKQVKFYVMMMQEHIGATGEPVSFDKDLSVEKVFNIPAGAHMKVSNWNYVSLEKQYGPPPLPKIAEYIPGV